MGIKSVVHVMDTALYYVEIGSTFVQSVRA